MARKKSLPRKSATVKEFNHSPFKSLKGLSAFDAPQAQDKADKADEASVKKTDPAADDLHAFVDEMGFLGVKPLPGRDASATGAGKARVPQKPHSADLSREQRDRDAFLEALGSMTTTFADDWPEAELGSQAVPRRIRQVARGLLKPQAELDLHGMTADEAMSKVRFFLQNSSCRGLQTLLIITGKGLHSSDGPVLRLAVEKLLAQMHELVIEWGGAPRRYGGSGALVVFLRRPAAE